jgi:UDPglucose--hexose-1-phosphate uridylyltransferase
MRKTSTRLADGRELLYFDEGDNTDRDVPDRRALPDRSGGSELRYDPVFDEWVAVASHRQDRTFLPPADECPLCPSRDGRLTEIPTSDYDVVVFENRFPSFAGAEAAARVGVALADRAVDAPRPLHSAALDEATGLAMADASDLFARRPGVGRCEVVCFTSDHDTAFAQLTPQRVRTVMEAWVDRTVCLGSLPGVEQVFCFENRGEEIGVTLRHPHGQIYAYPFVTPRTRQMLTSAQRYAERTSRNLFDDILDGERSAGVRIVDESEHWTAFVPAAARWPVEVHLYPRRRVPDLPALTPAERDDFGPLYLRLLRALDRYFDGVDALPYIAAWYQAPVRVGREHAALHLRVFSIRRAPTKLKYLAGSESAMGVWINDVAPEAIAARLRDLVRGDADRSFDRDRTVR